MKHLSAVRRAVFSQPWAIIDSQLDLICGIVESASNDLLAGNALPAREKPKLRYLSGVPVIPIDGVISKKMDLLSQVSGGTSIESLNGQLTEALAADSRAIVLHFDSPGGSVIGTPEFATRVFDARQSGKTIISVTEGLCASAAYWIGSQADEFYASEGSEVGGIGVVARILDDSRAMKNEGIDPVIIRSSELKAPGIGPVTPNQISAIQQRLGDVFDMFKGSVARARPMLDLSIAANGNTFSAKESLKLGLIDGIATLESIVAKYAQR